MSASIDDLILELKERLDKFPGTFERTPRLSGKFHPLLEGDVLSEVLEGPASNIAPLIDHTILKPEAKPEDVRKVCSEAMEYKFASVCVNPIYVPVAAEALAGSGVPIASVVGFPLGATSAEAIAAETEYAQKSGATEIDMVLPIGLLKAGEFGAVYENIASVVEAAKDAAVKVIIETCLLDTSEKIAACLLSLKADAEFVKTSTGFSTGGATVEDVSLMRKVVGTHAGVKASGGVRTAQDARAMIKAGANRIGASASVAIVNG